VGFFVKFTALNILFDYACGFIIVDATLIWMWKNGEFFLNAYETWL